MQLVLQRSMHERLQEPRYSKPKQQRVAQTQRKMRLILVFVN
jgi:hypothetical protein